jgi:hypothetical protein
MFKELKAKGKQRLSDCFCKESTTLKEYEKIIFLGVGVGADHLFADF